VLYDHDSPLFQFVLISLCEFIVTTVIALTRDSWCAVKFRKKRPIAARALRHTSRALRMQSFRYCGYQHGHSFVIATKYWIKRRGGIARGARIIILRIPPSSPPLSLSLSLSALAYVRRVRVRICIQIPFSREERGD
jgi:hypothetical protein